MDMEYLMCRNSSGIQEISSVTREFQVQINRYDGEGLRHEMEENGRLIKFLYNEDREVVAEETSNGTITRYIRGLGIISSDSEEAKTYYHYVSDEQGSITHVLSEDAEILNHYSYDAFGNIIEKTEKVENRFCYNGEMLDPVTQQYYLRARFYNPVIGRFTQEDTYYGDGLNLYQYCQANPVGYVDPSGHSVCPVLKSKYEEYRKQHPEATAAETYEAVTGKNPLKKDGSKGNPPSYGAYSTKIDSKVTVVEKQELPSWLIDTYKDGQYRTVVTNEEITVYRAFGYNAEAGGAFATSNPAISRVQTKVDSAILPEWKNTLRYEAEIVIPKGTILNIGRVGEQYTMSGARLAGDADQFLLPQNWNLNWIKSIRTIKP